MKIITVTMMNERIYRPTALTVGADEYVSKEAISTDLLPAIRKVVDTAEIE